jgi:hypothetical protein
MRLCVCLCVFVCAWFLFDCFSIFSIFLFWTENVIWR